MKIKKIFYLLIIFIFISSCTLKDQARLDIECPCIVTGINKNENNEIIEISELLNKYKFFIFKTKSLNYYSLGDTIK